LCRSFKQSVFPALLATSTSRFNVATTCAAIASPRPCVHALVLFCIEMNFFLHYAQRFCQRLAHLREMRPPAWASPYQPPSPPHRHAHIANWPFSSIVFLTCSRIRMLFAHRPLRIRSRKSVQMSASACSSENASQSHVASTPHQNVPRPLSTAARSLNYEWPPYSSCES